MGCCLGNAELPARYEAAVNDNAGPSAPATSSISSTSRASSSAFSASTLFTSSGKLHNKPEYAQRQINHGMQTMMAEATPSARACSRSGSSLYLTSSLPSHDTPLDSTCFLEEGL